MNLFESIYCLMYHDRLKEGYKPSGSPLTSNIVLSLCFVMIIVTLLLLMAFFVPDALEDLFGGGRSGRTIGRLMAIGLLIVIFPIIYYTIGTDKNYDSIINRFTNLSQVEQQEVVTKGRRFFIGSMAVIAIPMALHLIWG